MVNRPLARRDVNARSKLLIAYDLETTRIKKGDPSPLYITAHGERFRLSRRVDSLADLADALVSEFLTDDHRSARFVAWNGNNFDAYLVGRALLTRKEYVLRPYLTRSKNLRGMRVTLRAECWKKPKGCKAKTPPSWEFLDGMAMLYTMRLAEFLKAFAPAYLKLDAPDWEKEEFNPRNPRHVAYAERDSEGLYHGMMKAESIVRDRFGVLLAATIGNTAIRVFQARMPEGVQVWDAPLPVLKAIRLQGMRGGWCVARKRFAGIVHKYDLNQAYAAAMRETWLPCERAYRTGAGRIEPDVPALYRVIARKADNPIPFYWKNERGLGVATLGEVGPTWLCSTEVAQLAAEGWAVEVLDGWAWSNGFKMTGYVNELENLRINAPDGPKGGLGIVVKALGNNAFGKTVERLDGLELVLSRECPEGFMEYFPEERSLESVWCKLADPQHRDYHKPQIGAFITAHVRMVLRRAALLKPEAFVYADTDCIMTTEPLHVGAGLDVHPKIYGRWKLEAAGEPYIVVNKKTYTQANWTYGPDGEPDETVVRHAKGLNVKRLTHKDYVAWMSGKAPAQKQLQRTNWLKAVVGREMFVERKKSGDAEKKVARKA